MPGSILINDGRRSASPDRRVTFGNIERYDIMTSNEIKSNMNKRRDNEDPSTVNGNYPMTRLDNRIRKAVMLGFTPMMDDTVTYGEIVEFLVEFGVIANHRICNERQITAIIQASFPKAITKPSAKYSVVFVNLENRSDDVVKEELVRVTTEPIIDPASREAHQWINEADEEENYETDEDEELTKIEHEKDMHEIKPINMNGNLSKTEENNSTFSPEVESSAKTPQNEVPHQDEHMSSDGGSSTPVEEVPTSSVNIERSPCFNDNLQNNKLMSKSTGDVRSVSVKRNTSFSNKNVNRCTSVTDVAKNSENNSVTSQESDISRSTSTSNLQRKRSFKRSSDRSFVGSIRDRFRSSLRKKSNDSDSKESSSDREEKSAKIEDAKSENLKKETTSITVKKVNSKTTLRTDSVKTSTTNQGTVTKIGPNNDVRISVNKKTASSTRFGGSSTDIRKKQKISDENNNNNNNNVTISVNKNLSSSSGDIRASFRTSSVRHNTNQQPQQEVRATYRANSVRQSTTRPSNDLNSNSTYNNGDATDGRTLNDSKSMITRSTTGSMRGLSQTSDLRASQRKGNNNNSNNDIRASIRKTGTEKSIASTTSKVSVTATRKATTIPVSPKKSTGLRRTNSRAGSTPRRQTSANSSAQSTPTVSRENSKTNLKVPARRQNSSSKIEVKRKEATQQEKDILRIAKAFQQASHELTQSKDNIENFMMTVAVEDIEPCTNNRVNIDDLYDHIRHRMIVSQDRIFEGYRSDISVDMSLYFDLLFTTLASQLSRVGCEIVTDSTTQQKVCYLTHVKLVDYADDLGKLADEQLDEDTQASYV